MADASDVELERTPEFQPVRHGRSPGPWVAAIVLFAALAAGVYFYLGRGGEPAAPATTETAAPSTAAPEAALGAPAEPIDVPPLDMSDELVRKLVAGISSHPEVAAWLATDGLIRNFTVVVENIASGASPATHLDVVRPEGRFQIVDNEDRLVVDPRSYARYNAIADAAASVDPDGAARLYTTLRPRIEEAYRDLGRQESFDRALERAIAALLAVPVLEGDVELEPQGIVYQYADPRIEGLTPAQKHLARMGPRNVRSIQAALRQIAMALGMTLAGRP
jgi:hypothetical protein